MKLMMKLGQPWQTVLQISTEAPWESWGSLAEQCCRAGLRPSSRSVAELRGRVAEGQSRADQEKMH